MKKTIILLFISAVIFSGCSYQKNSDRTSENPSDLQENSIPELPDTAKPVIYLYPEEAMDVRVELNYEGELIADYPEYDQALHGWKVTAYPDGKIVNSEDGKEYSYLFWEAVTDRSNQWNLSEGFVVKGSETREFLQSILPEFGLTPKEYNEFIVYWYPLMKDNPYNLIHFSEKEYDEANPLKITPEPDSLLRVFMVYKSLDSEVKIKPQDIQPFNRKGFTVIEWGGTELAN